MDLAVFQDIDGGDHCDGDHHKECKAMHRVTAALDYYQFLVLSESAKKYVSDPIMAFQSFCDDIYSKRNMLSDYIHWVLKHKDPESLTAIRKRLHFVCESAKNCGATTRHYRDRRVDGDGANKKQSSWFTEKMDIIHFNVYHLHELGLRVPAETMQPDLKEDGDEQDESLLVDHALKKMAKVIESKRAMFGSERLDGAKNSKFTLQISEQKESGNGMYTVDTTQRKQN